MDCGCQNGTAMCKRSCGLSGKGCRAERAVVNIAPNLRLMGCKALIGLRGLVPTGGGVQSSQLIPTLPDSIRHNIPLKLLSHK
jgi:hypothetical protein